MPKKKIGKHLQFYIYCMNNDRQMPYNYDGKYFGGLCNIAFKGIISYKLFKLFSHGQSDIKFFAHGKNGDAALARHEFTTLRQTIVLFMAALNNEL